MKRNLLIITAILVGLIASCTPAQSVSGKYSGTYTATGLSVNSGSGTLTITENGANNINVLFASSGNSDYTTSNISVTRLTLLNLTYYDLTLSNYPWSVNGTMYENTKEITYTLSNDTSSFYVSFDGTK